MLFVTQNRLKHELVRSAAGSCHVETRLLQARGAEPGWHASQTNYSQWLRLVPCFVVGLSTPSLIWGARVEASSEYWRQAVRVGLLQSVGWFMLSGGVPVAMGKHDQPGSLNRLLVITRRGWKGWEAKEEIN